MPVIVTGTYTPSAIPFGWVSPHPLLRRFVQVRWGAVLGVVLVTLLAQFVAHADLPYLKLYSVAAAIAIYNWVFLQAGCVCCPKWRDSTLDTTPPTGLYARTAPYLHINLDFAALFLLLHFAGGLENPFLMLFGIHVVIAGILLPPRAAILEAVLATVLVAVLGVAEKTGILAHYPLTPLYDGSILPLSWLYVVAVAGAMGFALLALSGLTVLVMSDRRAQRQALIDLSRDLSAKNRKLERIDEMRRGLLAVATHDLKAPIDAVSSRLALIADGYVGEINPRQTDILTRSQGRLRQLRAFIEDVLSLTAIEKGDTQNQMEVMDIAPLLRQTIENYQPEADAQQSPLTVDVPDRLPPIRGAPMRLTQVLDNLVGNAVKYTPHGGAIHVRAAREGTDLVVEVRDEGVGIAVEDLGKVFEDFYRASHVCGTHPGTGLGLSVVRRIVRHHDGEITVDSELGKGSTFRVRLPILAED